MTTDDCWGQVDQVCAQHQNIVSADDCWCISCYQHWSALTISADHQQFYFVSADQHWLALISADQRWYISPYPEMHKTSWWKFGEIEEICGPIEEIFGQLLLITVNFSAT